VTNFGNTRAIAHTIWASNSNSALTAIIAFAVQVFFAYRIRKFTGNTWLTVIICMTSLLQCFAGIGTAIASGMVKNYYSFGSLNRIFTVWLSAAIFTDLLITCSLVWYLRQSKTGVAVTDDLLDKIMSMTVQTGLITAIWSILHFVLFLSVNSTSLNVIFGNSVSKIYANSLLSQLNARKRWSAAEVQDDPSMPPLSTFRAGERDIGSISGIRSPLSTSAGGSETSPESTGRMQNGCLEPIFQEKAKNDSGSAV
jgi:hypothetical protein